MNEGQCNRRVIMVRRGGEEALCHGGRETAMGLLVPHFETDHINEGRNRCHEEGRNRCPHVYFA
jgi:hypothetical protein